MKKLTFNIFDYLVLAIIILIASIVVFGLAPKKTETSKQVILKVVASFDQATFDQAQKENEVYFNSVNKPVKVLSVAPSENRESLAIVLQARGEIKDNVFIFEGLRVLVGQKAEIHGGYFVQGKVAEIKNAD